MTAMSDSRLSVLGSCRLTDLALGVSGTRKIDKKQSGLNVVNEAADHRPMEGASAK